MSFCLCAGALDELKVLKVLSAKKGTKNAMKKTFAEGKQVIATYP